MSPRLGIVLIAGALCSGPIALADPPVFSSGQIHPVNFASAGDDLPRQGRKIWGKGQFLPEEYWEMTFADWHRQNLTAPAEGFHWVSVGRDAYMVDADSGEITAAFIGVLTD